MMCELTAAAARSSLSRRPVLQYVDAASILMYVNVAPSGRCVRQWCVAAPARDKRGGAKDLARDKRRGEKEAASGGRLEGQELVVVEENGCCGWLGPSDRN